MNIKDYKTLNQKVKVIINDFDPIGLIGGGAPEDEYSAQINKIVGVMQKHLDLDSLTEEIYLIFAESFGSNTIGGKEKYKKIAELLLK